MTDTKHVLLGCNYCYTIFSYGSEDIISISIVLTITVINYRSEFTDVLVLYSSGYSQVI